MFLVLPGHSCPGIPIFIRIGRRGFRLSYALEDVENSFERELKKF